MIIIIAFVLVTGTIQAQELLPLPSIGNTHNAEVHAGDATNIQHAASRSVRDTSFMWVSYVWSAVNPNAAWNGNNIVYSFAGFGPDISGVLFADYDSSRGSCAISGGSLEITCNFGSSIPGNVIVSVDILVSFEDGIDWFSITNSVTGSNWYDNYVTNPYPYASNLVSDASFETLGLPSWKLVGPAKRACNSLSKTVSYDGTCALQVKSTGKASLKLNLSSTYFAGDVIYAGWMGASKNVLNYTKLSVISTSVIGKKYKSAWRMAAGTDSYKYWYVNAHIPRATNRVTLKVVGGASGKSWADLLNVLVVGFTN